MPISRPKIDLPPEAAEQSFWARVASGWLIPYVVLFGLLLAGGIMWQTIDITAIKAEQIYSLLLATLLFLVIGKLLVGLIRWLRRNKAQPPPSAPPTSNMDDDHDQPG